jgi:hypothetical protein
MNPHVPTVIDVIGHYRRGGAVRSRRRVHQWVLRYATGVHPSKRCCGFLGLGLARPGRLVEAVRDLLVNGEVGGAAGPCVNQASDSQSRDLRGWLTVRTCPLASSPRAGRGARLHGLLDVEHRNGDPGAYSIQRRLVAGGSPSIVRRSFTKTQGVPVAEQYRWTGKSHS